MGCHLLSDPSLLLRLDLFARFRDGGRSGNIFGTLNQIAGMAHTPGESSQAAVTPSSDSEDDAGEDELRACLEILEETLKDPRASPFSRPVDPVADKVVCTTHEFISPEESLTRFGVGMGSQVPTYTQVVKKPMDLGTVQLNFHRE